MWTLDDIRKLDFELKSPNIVLAEQMGLANGSSYLNGNGADHRSNGHRSANGVAAEVSGPA